jgi:CheY-like chemotaxis protein
MMMPRMNGAALMRELRVLAPGLAIISSSGFMAAATDDGEPPDLEALGVHTLLPKPYAESELLEALREALEPALPLGAGGKKKV